MESGITSSFIPKDAVVPQAVRTQRPTGFADLLILISVILLVASLTLAAGVFLYLQFLQTSIASKLEQLERAKEAFEPSLIQELTRLDDRMRAADSILRGHTAPSLFFHILEQLTLTTVSFSSLTFQAVDSKNISLAMKGIAVSVNSIALQADLLSKNGTISSPIFSNIDRRNDGVHFDMTAVINPQALRYANTIVTPQEIPSLPQSEEQGTEFPFGEKPET